MTLDAACCVAQGNQCSQVILVNAEATKSSACRIGILLDDASRKGRAVRQEVAAKAKRTNVQTVLLQTAYRQLAACTTGVGREVVVRTCTPSDVGQRSVGISAIAGVDVVVGRQRKCTCGTGGTRPGCTFGDDFGITSID